MSFVVATVQLRTVRRPKENQRGTWNPTQFLWLKSRAHSELESYFTFARWDFHYNDDAQMLDVILRLGCMNKREDGGTALDHTR